MGTLGYSRHACSRRVQEVGCTPRKVYVQGVRPGRRGRENVRKKTEVGENPTLLVDSATKCFATAAVLPLYSIPMHFHRK